MNENMQKIIANSKLCPIRKEDRRQVISCQELYKYIETIKSKRKSFNEDINSVNSKEKALNKFSAQVGEPFWLGKSRQM